MDAQAKKAIRNAARLIRTGKLDAARPILVQALKRDENLEEAWFLLSYVLPRGSRQEYALIQALRINPEFEKARQRLELLTGRSPVIPSPRPPEAPPSEAQPVSKPIESAEESRRTEALTDPSGAPVFVEEEPVEERRDGRRRLVLLAVVGIVLVALAFIFGRDAVAGWLVFPATQPTVTEPAGFRELPPTWTPTGGESGLSATPIPEAPTTGGANQLGIPLDANTLALVDSIQAQVAGLRRLERLREVENGIVTAEQAAEVLESLYLDVDLAGELADYEQVLAALGLIPDDYDLVEYELSSRADNVGGFYVPVQERIYLVGEGFGVLESFYYSHEFGHALVDQHHDLKNFGPDEECIVLSDACRAALALVEGDATLLSAQWVTTYGGPELAEALLDLVLEPWVVEDEPPAFVLADLGFPYAEGLVFVHFLHTAGGWARVDAAYILPPTTSEQILHPEKFIAGEGAREVDAAPVAGALGSEWRALGRDGLGEWVSYLILAQGASEAARIDEELARAAAAGWGGDLVQAFIREGGGGLEAAVAVYWVGDSVAEGAEFQSALGEHLGRRIGDEVGTQGDGRCWQGEGRASCLYGSGAEVLWLVAPDLGVAARMRGAYALFN